jgi:hypothetical protein
MDTSTKNKKMVCSRCTGSSRFSIRSSPFFPSKISPHSRISQSSLRKKSPNWKSSITAPPWRIPGTFHFSLLKSLPTAQEYHNPVRGKNLPTGRASPPHHGTAQARKPPPATGPDATATDRTGSCLKVLM